MASAWSPSIYQARRWGAATSASRSPVARPEPRTKWQVPRLSLRDASRETGVLTVVPERGLQVRAVDRKNVSQLDPRELADGPKETAARGGEARGAGLSVVAERLGARAFDQPARSMGDGAGVP